MQAHPQSRPAARNIRPPSQRFTPLPAQLSSVLPVRSTFDPHGPEAIGHDARNLLTALGLYGELLSAPGVLSEQHSHYAGELRLLVERGSALLRELCVQAAAAAEPWPMERLGGCDPAQAIAPGLFTASSGTGRAPSEPICDADAILRRFHPLLRGLAADAAEVILRTAPGLPPLPVSAQALERVTANLVGNAAAAIRGALPADGQAAAGTIWVSLDVRDDQARLCVEDSGPGMSPAVAAALSQPKAAAQGGSARTGRRGLGYPIVQGLVAESGGRLAVRPRAGGGTVVSVRWPLPSAAALRTYGADGNRGGACKGVLAC